MLRGSLFTGTRQPPLCAKGLATRELDGTAGARSLVQPSAAWALVSWQQPPVMLGVGVLTRAVSSSPVSSPEAAAAAQGLEVGRHVLGAQQTFELGRRGPRVEEPGSSVGQMRVTLGVGPPGERQPEDRLEAMGCTALKTRVRWMSGCRLLGVSLGASLGASLGVSLGAPPCSLGGTALDGSAGGAEGCRPDVRGAGRTGGSSRAQQGDGAVAGCSEVRPPPGGAAPQPPPQAPPGPARIPRLLLQAGLGPLGPGTCWGVGWGSGTSSFPTWSQASPHPTQP